MIPIKTPEEIVIMREGGRKLARIMETLKGRVAPGVTTLELDEVAGRLIRGEGAAVAFRGYEGFPGNVCISLNEEVVHGIPSERTLQEGDIVTLDIGLVWKGYYVDMARTFPVGELEPETARLVRVTKKALKLGIKKARAGATLGDVGNTIQRYVEGQGYGVVRELCGHGIGTELHEEPQVLNYGSRHKGPELKEGMVIAIEPMVTMGGWQVRRAKDGQTFLTQDGSLAAHFEDTIAVGARESEVLTKGDEEATS